MSKIAKLIASALNNSSANEAAQALKMAAAIMQREGVNPAEFIQPYGADSDLSAELEAEKKESDRWFQQAVSKGEALERLQRELEDLRRRGGGNPAELREAKELAIKWHRIAQSQEKHLAELAPAAVAAQERCTKLDKHITYLENRFKIAVVIAIAIAGAIGWQIGNSNGIQDGLRQAANSYQAPVAAPVAAPAPVAEVAPWDQNYGIKKQPKRVAETKPKVWHPRGGVYGLKAECANSRGETFSPEWVVNIDKSTVNEETHILPNGYALSLPDNGAPYKGHKFTLTYQGGSVVQCKVIEVSE